MMGKITCMVDQIKILSVEKDGEDGVIVAFSDGTTDGFVVEELLGLRPRRRLSEEPKPEILPQPSITSLYHTSPHTGPGCEFGCPWSRF
jgi:hypothetical protein